jgi:nitrate reductase gamma subunit
MDWLTFARGPALQWSLYVFLVGIVWRIAGVLLLRRKPDYSEPRSKAMIAGALKLMVMRSWPRKEFMSGTAVGEALGYVFHIGFFVVLFAFVPHILFFKDLTGVSWPGLSNSAIYLSGAITVAALIAVLVRRLTNPVLRLLSNFDDYFSWLVTILPVATGLMAAAHAGGRPESLLAIHLLSVELLLVWFPFGKLMHSFWIFASRGTTGALFARKGAAT